MQGGANFLQPNWVMADDFRSDSLMSGGGPAAGALATGGGVAAPTCVLPAGFAVPGFIDAWKSETSYHLPDTASTRRGMLPS